MDLAERDRLRETCANRGAFYNPWLHLAVTSISGLAVMGVGVWMIHDLKWWQVLFGAALFVLSNAAEWRIHRDLLHKRKKYATPLYDRHTPEHHVIFQTEDMAIRRTREFKLVLLPAYAIVAFAVGLLPMMALIWLGLPWAFAAPVDQHNLAGVFGIVTMGYIVSYEWLHLSYHLSPDSFVGSLGLVRVLRRHHALHHDPRLMQKWNFNVSLPLWDLLRGTVARETDRPRPEAISLPRQQP